MCEDCKYCKYDMLGFGYCNCSSNNMYKHIVIDDRGCDITHNCEDKEVECDCE